MSNITRIGDQLELVNTSQYPSYAKFPFPQFNPVQSRVFEIFDKDCNAVIAASTSAGKTVCAEMFMANEVRVRGGKAMFLAPLKALAKEKIDDWENPNHHFGDLKLSICSGDYRLTPARKKELEDAKIILMTSEMLNSRCRNYKSENNEWLKDIGTIIVDESHLLTVPGRGDHLEVGLMKLSQIAPNMRIIFLSATMPNVDQISEWLGKRLTNRPTYLLLSTYRPCPLGIHYETYFPADSYQDTEEEKIKSALQIIEDNPKDKYLVFVHTKKTGELAKKMIADSGYKCEFHYSDLDKVKRQTVEKQFKSGDLQIIVATSTLAWGINMPARRVIIVGVHRGMSEVDTWDVWQMIGRAGRLGFDPRGDAYILLPENQATRHMKRLKEHQPIMSRLLDHVGEDDPATKRKAHYKTLAFHLISEIHHGNIKNREQVHQWYDRSLAAHQAQNLDDAIVDNTLELLMKCGAIKEEDGVYKATTIGMISSMFYFSPFDVADLRRNFKALFDRKLEGNDLILSMCLGDVDSLKMGIVSKDDRLEMSKYAKTISGVFGEGKFTEAAIKGGFAYYNLLNGTNPGSVAGVARTLQFDFARLNQVLIAIDSMSGKWGKQPFLKRLQTRISYGVPTQMVPLVEIENIGKVRAERLWAAGIKNPKDIIANSDRIASILNAKPELASSIVESAKARYLVD